MTGSASARTLKCGFTRASYHQVVRTLFAAAALAAMLLASAAAAAPGGKSRPDAFPGRNGEIVFASVGSAHGPNRFHDLYVNAARRDKAATDHEGPRV
jgi:hypothetical protein